MLLPKMFSIIFERKKSQKILDIKSHYWFWYGYKKYLFCKKLELSSL